MKVSSILFSQTIRAHTYTQSVRPGHRGEKSINRDVKKCRTSKCQKAERQEGTDRDKYTIRARNEYTGKNLETGTRKRTIKIKLIHNT